MSELPADELAPADDLRPLSDAGLDDQAVWGLVDSAPDGIVLVDEAGKILLVNRKTEELFGYDRVELLGRSVDQLLPERFRQVHRAHRTRYRVEPRTRSMGAGLSLFGRRADGTEFPIEISLSPLRTQAGLRVVAMVRDITERVGVEAEAKRISEVLDATSDALMIFDADTLRFTYANKGAADHVGYSRDELLTMSMLHIAPEYTETSLRATLEPLVRGDLPSLTFTTVHRRRDGTDIPVEIVLQAVSNPDGPPRAFVKVARDISERLAADTLLRRAEQDVRVFEDRERIARDLHDVVIQKLFAAGLGINATAARSTDPDVAQRLAPIIDDLDDTIRELRSTIFSLNTRQSNPSSTRLEIQRVITDGQTALGFEPEVRLNGAIDTLPAHIVTELLPVLREALSNIARHADASTAIVDLRVTDMLRLCVQDNGIGIDAGADSSGGNGIRNTSTRATALGGTCDIHGAPEGGTILEWTVPLRCEVPVHDLRL
ncbi:MAG TPA: PAS domain S-box protein [Acidimicrobiales bacterium]|nr:PAS domain S-box protein [Acidimicrobiales bacterium]